MLDKIEEIKKEALQKLESLGSTREMEDWRVQYLGKKSPLTQILRSLGEPYDIAGQELHSSPSIGVSLFPSDGDRSDLLMKNADTAMYHAKSQGRNNCQFFTAAMNQAASERLGLERDLRAAIARGQLELHYQPKVATGDGGVVGVEALARWPHPTWGLVSPGEFIEVAERNGQIHAMGRWVLPMVACSTYGRKSCTPPRCTSVFSSSMRLA